MDRETFNKLSVQDQLKYVNNELSKGKSLRNISSELKMSKTTIKDRFKKIGYIFNIEKRQYIKSKASPTEIKYKSNTNILNENKQVIEYEYKHNTNIFNNEDNKNKMIDLLKKYDRLIEMLEWYNNKKNIIVPVELNINSDRLVGEVKTTTVRLYSDVWKDFRSFMNQYQEFKNMDMISMALIEFMDKYKKIV